VARCLPTGRLLKAGMLPIKVEPLAERPRNARFHTVCSICRGYRGRCPSDLSPHQRGPRAQFGQPGRGGGSIFRRRVSGAVCVDTSDGSASDVLAAWRDAGVASCRRVSGRLHVFAVLWGVPTLGVLSTMAALILGQMGAALVLDGAGMFGLQVQALSPQRIAAAVLVAAGLVLSRL
jgi:Putative inner membrane exporter, YdcZ